MSDAIACSNCAPGAVQTGTPSGIHWAAAPRARSSGIERARAKRLEARAKATMTTPPRDGLGPGPNHDAGNAPVQRRNRDLTGSTIGTTCADPPSRSTAGAALRDRTGNTSPALEQPLHPLATGGQRLALALRRSLVRLLERCGEACHRAGHTSQA